MFLAQIRLVGVFWYRYNSVVEFNFYTYNIGSIRTPSFPAEMQTKSSALSVLETLTSLNSTQCFRDQTTSVYTLGILMA